MLKLLFVFVLFAIISFPLFNVVYNASQQVIDEEFHLRQGLLYCRGVFDVWDPKITTFPGLYLISTALNYPLGTCNAFTMRCTSLLAAFLNIWLMYRIRQMVLNKALPTKSHASPEFDALTLSLLPPLYFFAHLYYTDVVSLTAVLGLMLFHMRNQHQLAALCGCLSVLMRQTNIVWVAMALGTTVIDKVVLQTLPFIKGNERYGRPDLVYSFQDIGVVIVFYCKRFYLISKQIKLLVSHLCGYLVVLVGFVGFVVWNGSIVVGDKEAHTASLHIPQLLYFSLFVLVFGVSIWLNQVSHILHTLRHRWLYLLGLTAFALAAVYANTVVHPYLLADNRHFTFYIWNRFYGAFDEARYLIVPIYIVGLVVVHRAIATSKTAGFQLCFWICTIATLVLQPMIEVRYFLVPFVILRLHTGPLHKRSVLVELALFVCLNVLAFHVFATKEIYWTNFEHVQRLIW